MTLNEGQSHLFKHDKSICIDAKYDILGFYNFFKITKSCLMIKLLQAKQLYKSANSSRFDAL